MKARHRLAVLIALCAWIAAVPLLGQVRTIDKTRKMGLTLTNINQMLGWLDSNKVTSTGGSMSGDLNMLNNDIQLVGDISGKTSDFTRVEADTLGMSGDLDMGGNNATNVLSVRSGTTNLHFYIEGRTVAGESGHNIYMTPGSNDGANATGGCFIVEIGNGGHEDGNMRVIKVNGTQIVRFDYNGTAFGDDVSLPYSLNMGGSNILQAGALDMDGDIDMGGNEITNLFTLTGGSTNLTVDMQGRAVAGELGHSINMTAGANTAASAIGGDITLTVGDGNAALDGSVRIKKVNGNDIAQFLGDGNVGIGVAPTATLHVVSTATNNAIAVQFETSEGTVLTVDGDGDGYLDGGLDITGDLRNGYPFGGNYAELNRGYGRFYHTSPYVLLSDRNAGEADWLIRVDADDLYFDNDEDDEALRIKGGTGNVGIGTASPGAKLDVVGAVAIQDIAAPPSASTNYAQFFVTNDVSAEMWVMDGAGNVTLLSQHDNDLRQIAKSHNVWTGEGKIVDLWKLAEVAEALTGETDIVSDYSIPRRYWDVEEDKKVQRQQAKIDAWESNTNSVEVKGERPEPYVAVPKPKWLVDWEKQ